MDQELAIEIARIRATLRRALGSLTSGEALQAGDVTVEVRDALERLRELADVADDGTLHFEHLRWSFHLSSRIPRAA